MNAVDSGTGTSGELVASRAPARGRVRAPGLPARASGGPGLNETDLIDLARRGDQEAFADLVRTYRGRIHRLVYRLLRDADEADDVTQEVFVKAWFRLESYKGQSAFFTWLYRVAVNAAADWRKKWTKRKGRSIDEGPLGSAGLLDEGPRPDRLAEGRELGRRLEEALSELPEKYRTILVLREYEGLSYEELARVLAVRKGTVESRLFRARERLRLLLASHL
jgi:RNA polymerase sigma-70 factor (ECF subfamily)